MAGFCASLELSEILCSVSFFFLLLGLRGGSVEPVSRRKEITFFALWAPCHLFCSLAAPRGSSFCSLASVSPCLLFGPHGSSFNNLFCSLASVSPYLLFGLRGSSLKWALGRACDCPRNREINYGFLFDFLHKKTSPGSGLLGFISTAPTQLFLFSFKKRKKKSGGARLDTRESPVFFFVE